MSRTIKRNNFGYPTSILKLKRGIGPRCRELREKLMIDPEFLDTLCTEQFILPSLTAIQTFLRSICERTREGDCLILQSVRSFSPADLYGKASAAFGQNSAAALLSCRYMLEAEIVNLLKDTDPAIIPLDPETVFKPAAGSTPAEGAIAMIVNGRAARTHLVDFLAAAKKSKETYWSSREEERKRRMISLQTYAESVLKAFVTLKSAIEQSVTETALFCESALILVAKWLHGYPEDEGKEAKRDDDRAFIEANRSVIGELLSYANTHADCRRYAWTSYVRDSSAAEHVDSAKQLMLKLRSALEQKDCRYEVEKAQDFDRYFYTIDIPVPNQSNFPVIKLTRFWSDPVVELPEAEMHPALYIQNTTRDAIPDVTDWFVKPVAHDGVPSVSDVVTSLRRIVDDPSFLRTIREKASITNGWIIDLDSVYDDALASDLTFYAAIMHADEIRYTDIGVEPEIYVASSSRYVQDASWNGRDTTSLYKAANPRDALVGVDFGASDKRSLYKTRSFLSVIPATQCRLSAKTVKDYLNRVDATDQYQWYKDQGFRPSIGTRPTFEADFVYPSYAEKPIPINVSRFVSNPRVPGAIVEVSEADTVTCDVLASDLNKLIELGYDEASQSVWVKVYRALRKAAITSSADIVSMFTSWTIGGAPEYQIDDLASDGERDVRIKSQLNVLASLMGYFSPTLGNAIADFVSACWKPGALTMDNRIGE